MIFGILKEAKEALTGVHKEQPYVYLEEMYGSLRMEHVQKKKAELLTREEDHRYQNVLDIFNGYLVRLKKEDASDGEEVFDKLRRWFGEKKALYEEKFDRAGEMLEYAFDFMEAVFAGGQELVVFVTELNSSFYSVEFLQEYSCERYYRYNQELLFRENTRDILKRIEAL